MQVWGTEKGEVLMKSTPIPMLECARSCALSPDGSLVAAGFDDGALRVQLKLFEYLNHAMVPSGWGEGGSIRVSFPPHPLIIDIIN